MEPAKIYYDHTLISDKHFFGGYLNLAQNNIDLVLQAYIERFMPEKATSNSKVIDIIQSSFSDKVSDSDYQNRVDYLAKYFPFIHHIGNKENKQDRSVFKKNFALLLTTIDKSRNFYTHFYHEPIKIYDAFYALLDSIFLQVVKDVRKNRLKIDKTRQLLKKGLKNELKILFDAKKEKLKQDKANGKRVNLDNESIENGVLNDAFYHLIYKDKRGDENITYRYRSKYDEKDTAAQNKINLSQSGLIFLLGLFLSKKESEDMRARIKGFKAKLINTEAPDFPNRDSNSLKYMATHWVFSYLSYKGLKHQLNSTFDKETLLIQIIDELSKVPDPVYNTLSQEKRDSFVEDINEYIKEEKQTKTLDESIVIHPVIRKRYDNKFNYFVIRFLDEFVSFPSLRFQIHVGNYVHDRRIKNVDGTNYETDRIVKEKINVFGRLSEITKLKTDYLIKKDKEELLGWEMFPNPSYNIENNNAFIYLKGIDSNVEKELKAFKKTRDTKEERTRRDGGKDAKYKITTSIGGKDLLNFEEPTALLSLNELPALLYELLVKGTSPEEIENKLKNKLKERVELLKSYETNQGLTGSQIPKKLRVSTNQDSLNIDKLKKDIDSQIDLTTAKLDLITKNREETRQFERGKPKRRYVFTNRELGQEATSFADDLVRFMPKEVRDKWKGYNHSQLQQSIAFYNQKPKEAIELLLPFWNFEDDTYLWNEGIKIAFATSRDFDSLYEKYLNNRLNSFKTIEEAIRNNQANKGLLNRALKQQNVWRLFNERLYRIDTTQSLKEKLLAKPVVFPRGVFDPKPTFIKGVNIKDNETLFADWYRYAYSEEHSFQKFYDYERDYTDLFETMSAENADLTMEKLRIGTDLYIKKIKTQDLFLKLIAEQLYQKVFEYPVQFSLSEFYLTQEERLAKNRIAIEQSKRQEGDSSDNVINDRFVWSMTVPFVTDQIAEPAVKLKDVGKFKRLIADSKVQHILSYNRNRTWNKLDLENELASYENIRREQLLKEIHGLEQQILQNNGFDGKNHPSSFEQDGNVNFKHYVVRGIIEKNNFAEQTEIEWLLNLDQNTFDDIGLAEVESKPEVIQKAYLLILIRNKIAHNQLLTAEKLRYLMQLYTITKDDSKTYAECILECTLQLIEYFKKKAK